MRVVKKVALDVAVALLLLLLSLIVAALVHMQRPDCVTCGATVGRTFWFIALGAFQPVLWALGISRKRRLWMWLLAIALGFGSYTLLEWMAGWLMAAGQGSAAISLGSLANEAGIIIGVASSWALIRRERRRFGMKPTLG